MNTARVVFVATAVLIGGGIAWQWQINARLRRENVQLRHALAETKALTADHERLAVAGTAPGMVTPPQSPASSVPGERTERAPANASLPPSAATEPPAGADRSTPQSVAETARLAIEGGDPDTLVNLITIAPDGLDLAQGAFEKLPAEVRARYGTPERMVAELLCATTPPPSPNRALAANEMPGTGGIDPALDEGTEYRTLHMIAQDPSGATIENRETYHNTESGWRWVISSREVLRRLAEAGLISSASPGAAPPPDGQ
ncbi:MAG TPA: hypothetical protein VGD81_21245 [Opitutaceae bacterium]